MMEHTQEPAPLAVLHERLAEVRRRIKAAVPALTGHRHRMVMEAKRTKEARTALERLRQEERELQERIAAITGSNHTP